jgi:signal peptidase I
MANASDSPASTRKSIAENVKDTLESIVLALILAFVFRAFIVEAFVIPTGSMAPTLYGDQLTNTCSVCGYEYALGVTQQMAQAQLGYPVPLRCPNCDQQFDKYTPAEIARPDSGDRILVHKWPLDVGGSVLGPHRWDVTVFKDPRDGTTNFIKRLVGLPGEVIEIIDGDLYAVPIDKLKPELVAQMEQLRKDVYAERTSGNRRWTDFKGRYAEINKQLLPLLKIQRKYPIGSPHETRAQESLWQIVYNNDYLPAPERRRVTWKPVNAAAAAAWNAADREITFKSDSAEPLSLRFDGKPIDDSYAYNNDRVRENGGGRQLVGDLHLSMVWFPDSGSGGLSLKMNRDRDEFVADLGVDGAVTVIGNQPDVPGHKQVIGQRKLPAFKSGQAVRVEFVNLDYRVSLLIDGQEVIASSDVQYAPSPAKLAQLVEASTREEDGSVEVQPSSVEISARNLHCRLRHVLLQRDVYYRSQIQTERSAMAPDAPTEVQNPYYLWRAWATAGLPMMLRNARVVDGRRYGGEYFMLGDNSPASKDSRLWWEIGPHLRGLGQEYQVSTVPEDQLIGKAFFVYWPAGYRPSWAPGMGLIPNVGRMRWIR